MHDPASPLTVRVQFLSDVARENPPVPATGQSAGVDLRACFEDERIQVGPGQRIKVPTGIAIEPAEPGWAGFVFSRSGLGAKRGLTVAQGVGVIDPDYRGEVVVWLLNTSAETLEVARGERVAQLVFLPVRQARLVAANALGETDRGAGGFGHTGRH